MTTQEARQAELIASTLAPVVVQLAGSPPILAIFLEMLVHTMQPQRTSRDIAMVMTKLEEAGLWLSKVVLKEEETP